MRKRNIKLSIWLDEDEKKMLKENSAKAGLTQSSYLRNLIKGYKPKEQPTEEIFELLNQLRGIGINMNQIARKANSLDMVDAPYLKYTFEKLKGFEDEVRKKLLGVD